MMCIFPFCTYLQESASLHSSSMNNLYVVVHGSQNISWSSRSSKRFDYTLSGMQHSSLYNLNFEVEASGSNSEVRSVFCVLADRLDQCPDQHISHNYNAS